MPAATPAVNPDLVGALKRLKLGRIAETLPERLVLADKQEMGFDELLLMILTDEIARRDNAAARDRLRRPGLDREGEGPPRSSHPGRPGALLRAQPVSPQARSRPRGSQGREDLFRDGADQDA